MFVKCIALLRKQILYFNVMVERMNWICYKGSFLSLFIGKMFPPFGLEELLHVESPCLYGDICISKKRFLRHYSVLGLQLWRGQS